MGVKAGTVIPDSQLMGRVELVKDTLTHPLWQDVTNKLITGSGSQNASD